MIACSASLPFSLPPDGPYHGKAGLLAVENPRYEHNLHDTFFKAAAAHGLPANDDFNSWSHDQVSKHGAHGTMKDTWLRCPLGWKQCVSCYDVHFVCVLLAGSPAVLKPPLSRS